MKKLRILAWTAIVLIAADFVVMLVALFLAKYRLFFVAGGILVALIIAGYFLKSARKSIEEQEKQLEDPGKE